MRVAPPAPMLVAAYVTLFLATRFCSDAWGRGVRRLVSLVFGVVAIAMHLGPPPPGFGAARADVVDVGQGLAVVLRGEDGRFALLDSGPSGGGRYDAGDRLVVPALVAQGCRRVEIFALSHDHDDHAGGAFAVLRDVDVGELWVGEGSERDPLTAAVTAAAVARGVAVRRLKRGDGARLGALELSILHPGLADRDRSPNDRCLVVRATTLAGSSILLPGDLESSGERALLDSGVEPRADVLVAPHHGADGSSTWPFLARVAPRLVVVSAGLGNRFGHPGAAALARYASIRARVLRTDREGTIVLEDEHGAWRVSVEKERGRDEGDDENCGQQNRENDAARSQRRRVVGEAGVTVPQPEQHEQP